MNENPKVSTTALSRLSEISDESAKKTMDSSSDEIPREIPPEPVAQSQNLSLAEMRQLEKIQREKEREKQKQIEIQKELIRQKIQKDFQSSAISSPPKNNAEFFRRKVSVTALLSNIVDEETEASDEENEGKITKLVTNLKSEKKPSTKIYPSLEENDGEGGAFGFKHFRKKWR